MIFTKYSSLKKFFLFCFIFFFSFYYCSTDLKRQSEPSGLRPDTSSLVSFVFDSRSFVTHIVSKLKIIFTKLFSLPHIQNLAIDFSVSIDCLSLATIGMQTN